MKNPAKKAKKYKALGAGAEIATVSSMRTALVALLSAAIAIAVLGCNNTPTLPLPPPVADVSPPDEAGFATVEGEVVPGAFVAVFNEDEGSGVIETPDENGGFTVRIRASVGHILTIWAFQGGENGQIKQLGVPAPPDESP